MMTTMMLSIKCSEVCDGQYNDSNNYGETSAPADELMTMAMVGLSVYVISLCGMPLMAPKSQTLWDMVQMVRLWLLVLYLF